MAGDPEKRLQQMEQLERLMRRELRRHSLSERERLVADALVDLSYGLGLESVRVPKQEVFTDMTGLARSHVSGSLKALYQMRILRTIQKDGMTHYTLNPNSEVWKVKIRVARETMKRAMELTRACNGLENQAPGAEGAAEETLNFKVFPSTPVLSAGGTDSVTVPNWVGEKLPKIDG